MTSMDNSTGMPLEELHTLRYQCAIKREGSKILRIVFDWSYLGGELTIRDYLFTNPEFTNRQFKNIFNVSQRVKLNASDPISSYDITLLYVVLQQVCDLNKNYQAWLPEDDAEPTLENLLYIVKQHRNILAHQEVSMSERDMNAKLDELQQLYKDIIVKAGERFLKSASEVDPIISSIERNINLLKHKIREPLGPLDVAELQQEFQEIQEQVKSNIEELSKEEVERLYDRLFVFDPAPWLLMNLKVKLTEIFTHFYFKRDSNDIQNGEEEQERKIHCDDILQVQNQEGILPEVLILTGEGGMGKSTFLKYLTEMWVKDPSRITGLSDIELLIYTECRHPSISTVDELFKHILHDTCQKINVEFEHLRETILHMQLLFVVDGFDEVNEASGQLVQEILNLPGKNIRIIITTRPGNKNHLTKLVPHTKEKLNLTIEGIASDCHLNFIEKLCSNLIGKEKLLDLRPVLEKQMLIMLEQLGTHMSNPLTLTLITLLFLQDPNRTDSLSTATQLYGELRNLLTEKLTERLIISKYKADLEYKCLQFLECSDELSYRALQRQEYELWEDTVQSLKQRCRELDLPPDEVLAAYFTVRHSRNGLLNMLNFTYHHLRLQEFSAANHILKSLTTSENLADTIQQFLTEASNWKSNKRFQNVLLHLTGLLACGHDNILAKYAEHLLSLLHLSATNIDPVLSHIVESRNNLHIIAATANKLNVHSLKWNGWWDIRGRNSFGALSHILNKINFKPEMLVLRVVSQTDLGHYFEEVVTSISQKVLKLAVDMPEHYSSISNTLGDNFVIHLTKPGSLCKLVAFRGSLSSSAIQKLPPCITELRLRINLDALYTLNERLADLQQLSILGVKYQDKERAKPEQFPALVYQGKTLCFTFDPPITDSEDDLDWASSVLAKMCSARNQFSCSSILFSETRLSFSGCESLLRHLHRKGVRAERRLDVYTYVRRSANESDQLNKLSQSLNLGTFLSHTISE